MILTNERNMMVNNNRSFNHEHRHKGEDEEEGYVGIYLINCNRKEVNVNYSVRIMNAIGEVHYSLQFQDERGINLVCTIQPFCRYGVVTSKKYADVVNSSNKILLDDSLCIDVVIQVQQEQDEFYSSPNNHSQKMLHFLESRDEADLLFNVRGTEILAHSQIVKAIAPILASCGTVVNNTNRDDVNTAGDVSIGNVSEDMSTEAFEIFLKYIYLGWYPCAEDAKKHGKQLINAANKYELVDLKMSIENILVGECVMTKDNVSDYILFADSQSCPLLKEYAIAFFRLMSQELISSECSKQLRESSEMLHETLHSTSLLSVTEIRKELGKRKLDADGSKQVLQLRLEKAKHEELILLE